MGLSKHQEDELLWAAANAGNGGHLNDALEERASKLDVTQNLDVYRRYESLERMGYIDLLLWADCRTYAARLTEEGRCAAEEIISGRLRVVPRGASREIRNALASGAVQAAAGILLANL